MRIAKSISVIISQENICYLLNNCKKDSSVVLTDLVVSVLVQWYLPRFTNRPTYTRTSRHSNFLRTPFRPLDTNFISRNEPVAFRIPSYNTKENCISRQRAFRDTNSWFSLRGTAVHASERFNTPEPCLQIIFIDTTQTKVRV